jgi:uncharacterized protein (DUF2249 family)
MIPDGETMELIAPHEPQPLRREFREQYGEAFDWEVIDKESGRCRVQITKAERNDSTSDGEDPTSATADNDGMSAQASDEIPESTAELDVRDLPPAQRHEKIFEAYADLDDGAGFTLVNDHDPKPLYHQFDAEVGPEFYWEYRKRDPGEFRVLIGKGEAHGNDPTVSEDPNAPF